jgi:hypothetical protein
LKNCKIDCLEDLLSSKPFLKKFLTSRVVLSNALDMSQITRTYPLKPIWLKEAYSVAGEDSIGRALSFPGVSGYGFVASLALLRVGTHKMSLALESNNALSLSKT